MDFSAKATPERGRLLLAPPVLYATAPLLDSTGHGPPLSDDNSRGKVQNVRGDSSANAQGAQGAATFQVASSL